MSKGALVKPSLPVLALCVLCLNACSNDLNSDSATAADAEQASPVTAESFTPRELTLADMPPDVQEGSWARLPTVRRDTLSPDDQQRFDMLVNPDSRYATGLRGPIGMWMYSPKMAEHMFPASTYLRFGADGQRDQRLTELAILTTASELGSQYLWTSHEPTARNAGLEGEIIELLRFGRPLGRPDALPGLGEREHTIVRIARELVNAPNVSADAFVTAQRLFGNTGVMDLAGLVGFYTTVNYTVKTFDVQRNPGSLLLLPTRPLGRADPR
jgi:4-carboxymuconolactone decarboxylase